MPAEEPLNAAIALLLLYVVTVCAITDIFERRIPNAVLLPALLLALIFNSLSAGLPGFLDCVLGLVVGMAVLFPFYFAGGTSAGDVKLLGIVGAFLGTNGALFAGVATLIFGGILGLLFIAWRVIEPILVMRVAQLVGSGRQTEPPLAATLTKARALNSEFPYAPAIACGAYFSLWHLGYFSQAAA